MPQPDDPVARMHNLAAQSSDDVVASTRPPGTTATDLDRMVNDVLTKLALRPGLSACEIGCGTGVLALPLAAAVDRFVGVDFATEALAVLRHRLDHAGLGDRATLVDVDVVGTDPIELEVLGPFDRVLVYATFHYVRDAQQATIFLARVVDLLAPGGMALIGNLPLIDLADQLAGVRRARGRARLATMWSWVVHEPTPVPRPPAWKVRALMATAGRQIRRRVRPRPEDRAGPPPSVPVMPLRIDAIEAMLAGLRVPTSHGWLAPAVGIPMFLDRADLLITRRAPD